jgi:predicted transcriptional regulator
MTKPLLDVVFASEKRKNVLLLLQDGPKQMETLLKSLGTTRQALLPQIRTLEEHYLVFHFADVYELTTIGKLAAGKMVPLVGTIEVFDSDIDYWGTHKLDFIPPHLLKRINELGKCEITQPAITEIHEFNNEFYEHSKISGSVSRASTYFHPMYSTLYPQLMDRKVQIYLIITREVLDRLQNQPDPSFGKLLENDLFHLLVYPKKSNLLTFANNDYYFFMSLFKDTGEVDNKEILCSNPSAIEWGKELFEHYMKDSIPVTEL